MSRSISREEVARKTEEQERNQEKEEAESPKLIGSVEVQIFCHADNTATVAVLRCGRGHRIAYSDAFTVPIAGMPEAAAGAIEMLKAFASRVGGKKGGGAHAK